VTPEVWLRIRSSYLQSMRRYRTYDFQNLVGIPGDPNEPFLYQNIYMRKFDLADRDRMRAEVSAEFRPNEKVAITPTVGWRDDRYGDALVFGGELGLKRDISLNAGVEVVYTPSRSASLSVSYMFEWLRREMLNNSFGAFGMTSDANWGTKIQDQVHTVTAAANVTVIPKQWDLKFAYTLALATSVQVCVRPGDGEEDGLERRRGQPEGTLHPGAQRHLQLALGRDDAVHDQHRPVRLPLAVPRRHQPELLGALRHRIARLQVVAVAAFPPARASRRPALCAVAAEQRSTTAPSGR
jgi:hypothetical protein